MKRILNITKALADENRVRALLMLQHGEMCVCKIIEMLELAPSTVSKHMSVLKQADLVKTRRDGKWTHYRLSDTNDPTVAEVLRWLLVSLKDDSAVLKDSARLKAGLPDKPASCCKN